MRFSQEHGGVVVLGRGASVMLDSSGTPTSFATERVETHFVGAVQPSVVAASAVAVANQVVRGTSFTASRAALAWLPRIDGAHLGWVFYEGVSPGTPYAPVVVVDAHSGDVLLRVDATHFDREASVYELNPITTPTLSSVTLDSLAPGAKTLQNERIQALNCVDEKTTTGGKLNIHFCELLPTAVADTDGNFSYTFQGDSIPEDSFAEVTMFYHASKAYAFFEGLGMPELNLKPLLAIANLRFPKGWDDFDIATMKNTSTPLEPYDNAFFSPEDPLGGLLTQGGGGLWFGQGTQADFAYDGNVVYHEFGHAMIDRTIQLVPYWHLDPQGGAPSPGAMNEGLADYFSSALTGDGQVGEYASKNISYGLGGSIRDLDNDDHCPQHLAGEPHIDSTFFSGALWKTRQSLPEADRTEYDSALLAALIAAPSGDLGYEDLAALFLASLSASPLGQPAADALAEELATRGALPECTRVLEYKTPINGPSLTFGNAFYAPGSYLGGTGPQAAYTPGVFQAHRSIPEGTLKLRVSIENVPYKTQQSYGQNSDPYEPAALIQFSADPISFTYDSDVSSTAGDPIPFSSVAGSLEVDVPSDATDVHVMVVNLGDEDGLFRALTLTPKGPPTNTGGTGGSGGSPSFGGTGGAGATGGGVAIGEEAPELAPGGGCACETRRSPSRGGLALLGLGALAWLFRRRD